MSIRKIKQRNKTQFLIDLKSVREVLVYTSQTCEFYKISKRELLKSAQDSCIQYYITDKIFKVKRNSMVIK